MAIPQSFIKSIDIEIGGHYKLQNTPHPFEVDHLKQTKFPFLGRKKELDKFLEFLNDELQKGVFLVTGFRGMGKTSFVNHVIKEYIKGKEKQDQEQKQSKAAIKVKKLDEKIEAYEKLSKQQAKQITEENKQREVEKLWIKEIEEKINAYKNKKDDKIAEIIIAESIEKTDTNNSSINNKGNNNLTETSTGEQEKNIENKYKNDEQIKLIESQKIKVALQKAKDESAKEAIVKRLLEDAKTSRIEQQELDNLVKIFEETKVSIENRIKAEDRGREADKKTAETLKAEINKENTEQEAAIKKEKRAAQKKQKKRNSNIIPIHLTLSQNQPKEADMLRLMVSTVSNKYLDYLYKARAKVKWFPRLHKRIYTKIVYEYALAMLLSYMVLTTIVYTIGKHYPTLKKSWFFTFPSFLNSFFVSTNHWSIINVIASPYFLLFLFITVFYRLKYWGLKNKYKRSAYNLIQRLVKRCQATISEEKNTSDEFGITSSGLGMKFGKNEKTGASFPIATTKEIEFELQLFLKLAKDEDELDFIFIFDELDKVDPAISTSYFEDAEDPERRKSEGSYQKSLRERKQAIINIISSLKNFFTGTDARFIFIAGREMFDASLADIADRQSSISSIFTYIFYIESLHKEKNLNTFKDVYYGFTADTTSSLSYASEEFLKHILFDTDKDGPESKNLYQYAAELDCDGDKQANAKVIVLLQSFVIYLTYRSNGSPRKLIKAIQEFITIKPIEFKTELAADNNAANKGKTYILAAQVAKRNNPEIPDSSFRRGINKILIKLKLREGKKATSLATTRLLHFGYYDQYRIGFINYLYRPFLIQHGRNFKMFSDNIVISTSYLFDHLLKFHHFAFSKTHLELIPEVLSTNKNTSLREHINEIIKHLSTNHLRESDIYLYDYKFYSRTSNEIVFLSKVFEDESAALNFTLDESYLIKLHVRGKIKELRSAYSQFDKSQQIFSISHLNSILGDLHFFDQEYDDAIEGYSDAIKPINALDMDQMNMRDFVTLITNKLKLGLCFERMNSFEQALAFYIDSNLDVKRFMQVQLLKGVHFNLPENKEIITAINDQAANKTNLTNTILTPPIFHSSMLNDLLQVINQSFLAILFIEEKLGAEGISQEKLFISLGNYFKIAEAIERNKLGINFLMNANVFLFTGKLLYFKNSFEGMENIEQFKLDVLPDYLIDSLNLLLNKYHIQFIKEDDNNRKKRKPVIALYMYILGLQHAVSARKRNYNGLASFDMLEKIRKHNNISYFLLNELPAIIEKSGESYLASHFRFFATLLSNIGDCLLCLLNKKDGYLINEIFDIDMMFTTKTGRDIIDFLVVSKLDEISLVDVFKCYALSANYFYRHGRIVSAGFQYRKILHVLRLVLKSGSLQLKNVGPTPEEIKVQLLQMLEECLLKPIIIIVNRNAGNSNRHMAAKSNSILKSVEAGRNWDAYVLNNLSNHTELREPILLYMLFQLKIGIQIDPSIIDVLISNYNSIATQFTRILELDFHARYTLEILKKMFTDDKWDIVNLQIFINHAVAYLFDLETVLQVIKLYGNDYTLGHSYFAYSHFQMAKFLTRINEKKFIDKISWTIPHKNFIQQIKDNLSAILLNRSSYVIMDIVFHYQMAKDAYEKAIQLHTGGLEYKKMIGEMIYLEDDFNDNAYHFGACTDRYLIANGVFEKNMEKCDEYVNSHGQYNSDAFLK